MIRFNANLFRIAMQCASKEETRYYLRGVYVQPHHVKGVTMVATDGHKLIVLHDESGSADESAIINLGDALKLCKPKRNERHDVVIETGSNTATVNNTFAAPDRDEKTNALLGTETLEDTPFGMAYGVKIDGSFPDYRRVIPKAFSNTITPTFASWYLSELALVGTELAAHFHDFKAKTFEGIDRRDAMQICAQEDEKPTSCPALVTWPSMPKAFAVLMPVRSTGSEAALPDWYSPVAPIAQAAE
jgi:hypothetical protein